MSFGPQHVRVARFPATSALVRVGLAGVCVFAALAGAAPLHRAFWAFVCGLAWGYPLSPLIARLRVCLAEVRTPHATGAANGRLRRGCMRASTCAVHDGTRSGTDRDSPLIGVVLRSIR
jgi:hypothetical protein